MKKNRFALILTLLLLLVAVFLVVNNRKSTLDRSESVFAVQDTASITKIFIANMDSSEVLLERANGGWVVNKHYEAQVRKVDVLLNTIMKLKVRAPVSAAGHNNVIKRMAGTAVKVEIYQVVPRINLFGKIRLFPHEVKSKVYYVGDATKDNLGTFMLMEGAEDAFIVFLPEFKGFVSTRYSAIEDDWRDHKVFRSTLGDIKSIRMEFGREPEKSFLIEATDRNNYQVTRLIDNQLLVRYDTLRLLNYLTSFSDVRFEALLNYDIPADRKDSIIASPYLHRITLTNMQGKQDMVTTFEKRQYHDHLDVDYKFVPVDLDRLYGLVNNNKDFVLLQYYSFDKVLRPISFLEGN